MRVALVILLLASSLAAGFTGERLRARAIFEDPLPAAPNPALGKWLGSLGDAGAMGYWLTLLARVGGWMTEASTERVKQGSSEAVKLTTIFGGKERQAWGRAYLEGINAWAPNFPEPYLYGGIMFYWYAHDRKTAEAFLERGYAAGIKRWEIPFYIAVYASRANDRKRASEWIRKAAAFPDAPAIVPLLATKFLSYTGDRQEALAMMEALADNLPPQMEQFKETIVADRERLRILIRLNEAADRYAERYGKRPYLIEHLIEGGLVTEAELKPYGGAEKFIFEGANVTFR